MTLSSSFRVSLESITPPLYVLIMVNQYVPGQPCHTPAIPRARIESLENDLISVRPRRAPEDPREAPHGSEASTDPLAHDPDSLGGRLRLRAGDGVDFRRGPRLGRRGAPRRHGDRQRLAPSGRPDGRDGRQRRLQLPAPAARRV